MPNLLAVPPEKRCTVIRANGSQCQAIRLTGQVRCRAHSPWNGTATTKVEDVTPDITLQALVHLDPTDPAQLQQLRLGLLQHVAAGTIEHQAASACLRFAQAAYDAQPHKVKESALTSMMAKLVATEPKPVDS